MGRKAQFNQADFFHATLRAMIKNGPMRTSIAAISQELAAPTGSIYHRYSSLQHVLAETWLTVAESFQYNFLKNLNNDNGLEAALNTPRQSRLLPDQAQLLLCYHREEIIQGTWPVEVKDRAEKLKAQLKDCFIQFVKTQPGKNDSRKKSRIELALIHMPLAATKPWLKSKGKIPLFVDDFIIKTYNSLMES